MPSRVMFRRRSYWNSSVSGYAVGGHTAGVTCPRSSNGYGALWATVSRGLRSASAGTRRVDVAVYSVSWSGREEASRSQTVGSG